MAQAVLDNSSVDDETRPSPDMPVRSIAFAVTRCPLDEKSAPFSKSPKHALPILKWLLSYSCDRSKGRSPLFVFADLFVVVLTIDQ